MSHTWKRLFRDRGSQLITSFGYNIGTSIAHLLLNSVGDSAQIHYSVKYWNPSRIFIGKCCEIRQGTFLDARSPKQIAISIGDRSRIKDYVGLVAYGGEIVLGQRVLIGRCSTIFGHGGVYIGNDSMIGPHSVILSSNHMAYLGERPFQEQGFTRESIAINDNVWIGANCTILGGVKIDRDVVVAAGAVVQQNLSSGWIYAGVPAKPIKPLEADPQHSSEVYFRDWGLL